MKNNLPPRHRVITTADGSITFFSEQFQETCHSTSGAKAETLLHYVKGCQIEEKLTEKESITILEVGFGLGLGFLTTYEVLKNQQKRWRFISLELDEDLLKWFVSEYANLLSLENIQWIDHGSFKVFQAQNELVELIILCGDARQTLPTFMKTNSDRWDAIYQDAFSPRRNPILWTKEWFSLLKKFSAPEVILATYSSSSSIRKSLIEAGWSVHPGEKFGPKRSSTRASLTGHTDEEVLLHLNRSPVEALSDDNVAAFLRNFKDGK
jgi:tRNA U34 5-methylaminomethyl-2-thiouridine-forming methyltransferase MnmC